MSSQGFTMYLDHYGFSAKPFSKTPDPRFIYGGRGHVEALSRMQYAVEEREIMVLTGEIGSKKTTVRIPQGSTPPQEFARHETFPFSRRPRDRSRHKNARRHIWSNEHSCRESARTGEGPIGEKVFPSVGLLVVHLCLFRARSTGGGDSYSRSPDNRLCGGALAARALRTFSNSSEDNGVFGENCRLVFLGAV